MHGVQVWPLVAELRSWWCLPMQELQETQVWSLGWEDPLEKGMATHSSILAWRIPWTEEPGRLQSMRSERVGHEWATELAFSNQKPQTTAKFFFLFYWVTWANVLKQGSSEVHEVWAHLTLGLSPSNLITLVFFRSSQLSASKNLHIFSSALSQFSSSFVSLFLFISTQTVPPEEQS